MTTIKEKRQKDRTYYSEHTEEIIAKVKRYYEENKEEKQRYVQEYQMRRKIRACEYLGGKCIRCPQDHPSTLQFHHRDPSAKLFTITTKVLGSPKKYPWDTVIVPELDKCDLLCANCHFLHHASLTPERVRELQAETPEQRDSHYKRQE